MEVALVLVLSGRERAAHKPLFEKLFKLRYDVFIMKRGWSLPSRHNQEIDQYDTDDAVYFVNIDEFENIIGHVRMTPTMTSSLTADYFPHLFETDVDPRSPRIYEATRYMVLPANRDRGSHKRAKTALLVALVEWCRNQRLTHLQTVIDAGALRSFVEITLLTTPMGLAHSFGGGKTAPGGGECLAFRWPITDALLQDIRAYGADAIPDQVARQVA